MHTLAFAQHVLEARVIRADCRILAEIATHVVLPNQGSDPLVAVYCDVSAQAPLGNISKRVAHRVLGYIHHTVYSHNCRAIDKPVKCKQAACLL